MKSPTNFPLPASPATAELAHEHHTYPAAKSTGREADTCAGKMAVNSASHAIRQRFDAALFCNRLTCHLRRWGFLYLLTAIAAVWFDARYKLGINSTTSLPQQLFLIQRGEQPVRGDHVAFRWLGGGPYPAGATFIKIVAGVPGDVVTRLDEHYFVNGLPVGQAKPVSRQGNALEPGPTGTVPEGFYYVRAPHPDSLDSRYALTGWVSQAQILGRAHALF